MNFLKQHWPVILIGILGLIVGAFFNYLSNRISNNQLLASITAQINALQIKGKAGRLSAADQTQLIALQAQQNLLKNKI